MKILFHYTILLITGGISFSACQQILTDAHSAEIERELRDLTEEFIECINDRDTAKLFNYCSNHFTLLSMGDKRVVDQKTRADWKSAVLQSMTGEDQMVYTIEDIWIEVYAHNSANVCHTWIKTTIFGSDSTHQSRGATTWTMYREKEGWKIKHAHISAGQDQFRAVEGESVYLTLKRIKPERKEIFEEFWHEILMDETKNLGGMNQLLIDQMRFFHPGGPNSDGTFTYAVMSDPTVPGASYSMMYYLSKIYGEEEAREKVRMYSESLVEDVPMMEFIQSRH